MGYVNIPARFFDISKMKEHVENRKNQIGKSTVIYENGQESKNVRVENQKNDDDKIKKLKNSNMLICNDMKNEINKRRLSESVATENVNGSEIKKSFTSEKKGRTSKYSNESRVTYVDAAMRGD